MVRMEDQSNGGGSVIGFVPKSDIFPFTFQTIAVCG